MDPTLFVFIPAYQAARTIESVLERIPADAWDMAVRVVVINDGSRDDTAAVVERCRARYPKLDLFSFEQNRGYGDAVRKGLELARASGADYTACLHSDGQYPPEKLAEFTRHMARNGVDVLQGSRHKEGTALQGNMPYYKWAAGLALTWIENRAFGLSLTDYHSGYMFYSRRALEQIPFDGLSRYFDFDVEVIASARTRGLKIDELAIPTRYADEDSHLNPIRYGFHVLWVVVKYKLGAYNPPSGRDGGSVATRGA